MDSSVRTSGTGYSVVYVDLNLGFMMNSTCKKIKDDEGIVTTPFRLVMSTGVYSRQNLSDSVYTLVSRFVPRCFDKVIEQPHALLCAGGVLTSLDPCEKGCE